MSKILIPVASPVLNGNEKKYVLDCLDTNWISSRGPYIEKFESEFARLVNVPHAISCANGTVALQAAFLALGLKAGDEVIVPTLTYIATVNTVCSVGATPVFADCDRATWNISLATIKKQVTAKTKAIVVVPLYGVPVDLDPILAFAKEKGLFVVEDAAEALGATYKKRPVGSLADVATFSFFGNKILTTGEGGMITTSNATLAAKIRMVCNQGQDPNRRYWFPEIGYNFRMTNIQAAIGLAQLETFQWHWKQRTQIFSWYRAGLAETEGVQWQDLAAHSTLSPWMVSLIVPTERRDKLMADLAAQGIESRPLFIPIHQMPSHQKAGQSFPVAEDLGRSGLSLPTWSKLTKAQVDEVCRAVNQVLGTRRKAA